MSRTSFILLLLLTTSVVLADDVSEAERTAAAADAQAQKEEVSERAAGSTEERAQPDKGPKRISGMSILGNQEAPKSLVIVPWKSSEIGGALGISTMLDDSRRPVDKDVFMRALRYYEIRSGQRP